MTRLRSLLWLIALSVFALSPMASAMTAAHAPAATEQATAMDCADHAPPPDCPSHGTAKHAAGTCCPLMTGVVALLQPTAVVAAASLPAGHVIVGVARLSSLASPRDPPPPRP